MQNKEKELLSLTNDYVFRKIFGEKDVNALGDFLTAVLDMPEDEFAELSVEDPHLYREYESGKGIELDVMARSKNGEIINIEIQVNPEKAFRERIAYYNARILSGQMGKGEDYYKLKRTISVVITDFILFEENDDCFNRFLWYNEKNGTLLTRVQEINTLELPKLSQDDDGSRRWQWLKLLKLRKVDEMEAVAKDNKAIKNVISRVYEMSEDERERRIAFLLEKTERDRLSRLAYAEDKGIEIGIEKGIEQGLEQGLEQGIEQGIEQGRTEVARGMKADGEPAEKIARYTGLSIETIAAL